MNDSLDIRINPGAEIRMHRINERFSCAVVDDFLLNPEEVISYAKTHQAEFEFPERSYPGSVLDLPAGSWPQLTQYWRRVMSRRFPFARTGIEDSCQVSLTTLPPADFSWIQRLPHTDFRRDAGKDNYALLVYLFDAPEMGGTGFFRYRDEAFWASMARRQVHDPSGGIDLVRTRYPLFNEPPEYPHRSNEAFELLFEVEARFNRMVCYSGDVPHSACIADASLLSDRIETGRLTLNAFAQVWPRS